MPLNKNFLTGFILFMPNLFARLNITLQNIKHQVGSASWIRFKYGILRLQFAKKNIDATLQILSL